MGWVGEMCRLYLLRKVHYYIRSLMGNADYYEYVISYNICMQVVWDTSYRLGCGAKYCASVTSSSSTSGHIVVCQYGPG